MSEIRFADGDSSFLATGNDTLENVDGDHIELLMRQLHEYRTEIEALSEALQNERMERNQMEKEAIEILKRVKEKYESNFLNLKQRYEQQLDAYKQKSSVEYEKLLKRSESQVNGIDVLRVKLANELESANNENNRLKSSIDCLQIELESSRCDFNSLRLKLTQCEHRFEEKLTKLENEKCYFLKQISSLSETLKQQESALRLSSENEIISQKIKEFLSRNDIIGLEKWKCYEECKKENLNLSKKLKELEALNDNLKQMIEEKRKEETDLKVMKIKLEQLQSDFHASAEDLCHERSKCGELLTRFNFVESMNDDLRKENDNLKEELDKKENSMNKMKTACEHFDSQAQYLETLNEVLQREKENLIVEKQEMAMFSQMLQQNVESLRTELNVERQKCDDALQKLEMCRESYRKEVESKDVKLQDVEEALTSEMKALEQYREKADYLQEQVDSKNSTVENLFLRIEELENELLAIKEEASTHITTIRTLKVENNKLCNALEQSLSKYEKSQSRIDVVVNEMDAKEADFEREKLKLQETINQQLKLIDFLQTKSEKQKKPWFAINSPRTNLALHTNNGADVKEIEAALNRERLKNQLLIDEIEETKLELKRCESQIKRYEQNLGDNQHMNLSVTNDIKINNDKSREIFELSNHFENAKALSSSPSAPPFYTVHSEECEATSPTSSLTTDNNYCELDRRLQHIHDVQIHDNCNEFTFTDSILAELSE